MIYILLFYSGVHFKLDNYIINEKLYTARIPLFWREFYPSDLIRILHYFPIRSLEVIH